LTLSDRFKDIKKKIDDLMYNLTERLTHIDKNDKESKQFHDDLKLINDKYNSFCSQIEQFKRNEIINKPKQEQQKHQNDNQIERDLNEIETKLYNDIYNKFKQQCTTIKATNNNNTTTDNSNKTNSIKNILKNSLQQLNQISQNAKVSYFSLFFVLFCFVFCS
jgi:CHAT domain-containing protein